MKPIDKIYAALPDDMQKLREAAEPLIKLLCSEYDPHHTVIVTSTNVELLEGRMSIPRIFYHVKD